MCADKYQWWWEKIGCVGIMCGVKLVPMATLFDEITPELAQWITEQHLFFVSTAPLSGDGLVNVSPKGPISTLAVLNPRRVAYLDMTGSGAETPAHLRENGRICLMLCSFTKRPRILRLHGTGTVTWSVDPNFSALHQECGFPVDHTQELERAIITIDVSRIAHSCGYGVPLMDFVGERNNLEAWAQGKLAQDPGALETYRRDKNSTSLDGLPAWPNH